MSTHRSPNNWSIHDHLIQKQKELLEEQGKYVVANPNQERNESGSVIRNGERVYPDLVVRPSREENITQLYEVETKDSVDEDEVDQWKTYNAGKSSFYLIVPEGYVEEAERLIRESGFSIDGFYYYDESLNIYPAW